MTDRTVTHATFTLERVYPVPRERVYVACSTKAAKQVWFAADPGFSDKRYELDFRIGGRELSSARHHGVVHHYRATFLDIVENERIITAYDMDLDDRHISVSLATLEFRAHAEGTRLVLTEQGAFLDGFDDPKVRETGTVGLLDALGAYLSRG